MICSSQEYIDLSNIDDIHTIMIRRDSVINRWAVVGRLCILKTNPGSCRNQSVRIVGKRLWNRW